MRVLLESRRFSSLQRGDVLDAIISVIRASRSRQRSSLQACQRGLPRTVQPSVCVDDGVCTQTAPVVSSSHTLADVGRHRCGCSVPHTFQRVAELSSTSEKEVPPSHPHSSRGTPSSTGGGCNRRFALGSCSVCCRSGCCAALTAGDVWAWVN